MNNLGKLLDFATEFALSPLNATDNPYDDKQSI